MTTGPQRLARLEGAYEHLATRADLKDLELRLTAEIAELTRTMAAQTRWLAGLVLAAAAAAAGVVIAVDRLAG